MNTNVLNIGDKALIQKKERKDENEYTSQIQDINGNELKISTPMYKSALIRLPEQTRVELLVFGEGKVYEFDAEVKKTTIEDKLYFTDIVVVTPVQKVERRCYFRVKTTEDILVKKIDENNQSNPNEYIKAITIDISGGGLQFSSTYDFEDNTMVEIKIDVDGKELLLDGKLLNKTVQQGLGSYKYTVEFLNLDNLSQEEIISYVFKVQREKLRK